MTTEIAPPELPVRNHASEPQHTFPSGAKRSKKSERFDLICPVGLKRIARRYALGAAKYSDFNWCLGVPASECLNHLIAHVVDFMENGNSKDDNLAAIAWNAIALMHYEEGCRHHEAPFRS